MQRLREGPVARCIALLLFTIFTGACASWQTIEGSDLPSRVRVITTASDTVDLQEPRVQGDSMLVGRDLRADASRAIPTDSVSRLETKRLSERDEILIAMGAFFGVIALVPLLDGGFWEW